MYHNHDTHTGKEVKTKEDQDRERQEDLGSGNQADGETHHWTALASVRRRLHQG